jgi:hypothetical protein
MIFENGKGIAPWLGKRKTNFTHEEFQENEPASHPGSTSLTPYCLIGECYPGSAVGANDPI